MKTAKQLFLAAAVLVLILGTAPAWGNPVAKLIYYAKTTTLTPGPYTFRFSLWNTPAGGAEAANMLWWEAKTLNLTTQTITTYLGDVSNTANRSDLIGNADFSEQYWVQVDEVTGTAPNFIYTPVGGRTRFSVVPYAMHSITAETAASGGAVPSVTAGNGLASTATPAGDVTLNVGAGAGISVGADAVSVMTGGVTNAMLAPGAVTAGKVAYGAVTEGKIGPGAVTSLKIAAGAVSDDKIAGPISGSKISSTGLNADTVDGLDSTAFVKTTGGSMTGPLASSVSGSSTYAFYGMTDGTGKAGAFVISNPANSSSALWAWTEGTGYAGEFHGPVKVSGATSGIVFADGTKQTTASEPSWSQIIPGAERWQSVFGGTAALDRETGLVWQIQTDGIMRTWLNADDYCHMLALGGRFGWRLPTIEELSTLVDSTTLDPALPAGHPFTDAILSGAYWSSTAYVNNPSVLAWGVFFSDGTVTTYNKISVFLARCVRGRQ